MKSVAIAALSYLFAQVQADWGRAVYDLTYSDDTGEMLEEEAMVFVIYQDRNHEDNANFVKAFDEVALELHVYGISPLQWFSVDTIEYPDLEDPRVERAIHNEDGSLKGASTGNPTGSYVYVMYEGNFKVMDFIFDPAGSFEENAAILRLEALSFIEPVSPVAHCSHIEPIVEGANSPPFSVLLFQFPRDADDDDIYEGKSRSYYILTETARRERFLYGRRDVAFYWMEDLNCMNQMIGTQDDMGRDAAVMFSRERDSKTGEMRQNPKLVNRYDLKDIQRLNRWLNTVISDVQKTFSDRIIFTIMDEKMFACILVRNGGKPQGEEDYADMRDDDLQAVTAFEKFTNMTKFKQQRILFFYADPFLDTPIDDSTNLQEFFQVNFQSKEDLPAFMLANTAEERLDFLQPIETITEDSIADMLGQHVFQDMFTMVQENDTEGLLRAYDRGAPEPKPMPPNPDAFRDVFASEEL